MTRLLLALSFLISTSAFARSNDMGVGIILGNPTGLSTNYILSPSRSIDAALAYDFSGSNKLHLHSTYLFRYPNSLFLKHSVGLGWYTGVGARILVHDRRGNDDDFRLGIRGAIGASLEFKKAPVEIFAELAPVMDIIEKTQLDVNGGVGTRFYF